MLWIMRGPKWGPKPEFQISNFKLENSKTAIRTGGKDGEDH
jgi:hypothetical protein